MKTISVCYLTLPSPSKVRRSFSEGVAGEGCLMCLGMGEVTKRKPPYYDVLRWGVGWGVSFCKLFLLFLRRSPESFGPASCNPIPNPSQSQQTCQTNTPFDHTLFF